MVEGPYRLLVIDHFGVEAARREIYRSMCRTGELDIDVVVPTSWQESGGVVRFEPEQGRAIRVHERGFLFGHRHQRVMYHGLCSLARQIRPHMMLSVTQPENYASLQARLVRRLCVPSARLALFSSRNIDVRSSGYGYKFAFTHAFCDWVARKWPVDLCLYRPKSASELLSPYALRAAYVPHWVDCSLFSPRPRNRSDSITLGYIGRLVKAKGVHLLIAALRELPGSSRALVVGSGPEENALRDLAKTSGVADRVKFVLPVPYSEVPSILNTMDVLVLPSMETLHWKELFGRVLIEAMACGVPVVASDSGGIPEVVGNAGLLFPVGNVEALAATLSSLAESAEIRKELGMRGRERAYDHYDVQIVAAAMREQILQALRGR